LISWSISTDYGFKSSFLSFFSFLSIVLGAFFLVKRLEFYFYPSKILYFYIFLFIDSSFFMQSCEFLFCPYETFMIYFGFSVSFLNEAILLMPFLIIESLVIKVLDTGIYLYSSRKIFLILDYLLRVEYFLSWFVLLSNILVMDGNFCCEEVFYLFSI